MKKKLIVIIDDDADDCEILSTSFDESHHDLSVIIFNSGTNFLVFLRETAMLPDLVITDLYMPGIDGLEIINAIRNNVATQNIPIILLSTIKNEIAFESIAMLKNVDYLIKPNNHIDYSTMADTILLKIKSLVGQSL